MIVACLAEGDDWLGNWKFKVLPRVGERIIIPPDHYEVTEVEHWPNLVSDSDTADVEIIELRLRVRLVSEPL